MLSKAIRHFGNAPQAHGLVYAIGRVCNSNYRQAELNATVFEGVFADRCVEKCIVLSRLNVLSFCLTTLCLIHFSAAESTAQQERASKKVEAKDSKAEKDVDSDEAEPAAESPLQYIARSRSRC